MLRILLIVLVFIVFIVLLNRGKSVRKAADDEGSSLPSRKTVKCAVCELHVQQKGALKFNGLYFCCSEHQRKMEGEC
jgi:hypothetical protein